MTALAFVPVDPIEGALARLAHWRRMALRVRTDFEADLCEWFGLTPFQARVVAVLYVRGPTRRDALLTLANVASNTLSCAMTSVREALGDGSIISGAGVYQLTQLGRAACDEAVEQVGIGRLRKELAA